MISYNKALKILKKSKINIREEIVDVKKSINRVSSKDIYTNVKYPSANNSAMDGIAIRSSDTTGLSKKKYKEFKIIKRIVAGDNPKIKNFKKFQVVEIMTGALIPKQLDSVIPFEKIEYTKNKKSIIIKNFVRKSSNIRLCGSDYRKKEILIKKGTIVDNSHILAFKSLGIEKIYVKKKPNVLFFSTGNELSNKVKIPNWKIRNSNSYYIESLSENFLFNYINGGILKDNDEKKFKKILLKMLKKKNIDLILSSGAVSAGKSDFIPSVIKTFKLLKKFKGVYMRPGKPILFAKFKSFNKVFFGLPGNPISTAACFRFFVYPYLSFIMGLKSEKPMIAKLNNVFKKRKIYTKFVKSKLFTTKDGITKINILSGQESFRIKSFIESNVWSVLKAGKIRFKKGDLVECFSALRPNK